MHRNYTSPMYTPPRVHNDGPVPKSVAERFWKHIITHPDGCWEWVGATKQGGYGKIGQSLPVQRTLQAHRVSWEIHYGPVPKGIDVLHTCDNPPCCRPDHLFLGTQVDNSRDMVRKGRHVSKTRPESLRRGDNHPFRLRPETVLRGEKNSRAKLTEETIREIRMWHQQGTSQQTIANRYGVDQTTISTVVRRKTWKHVT